MNSNDFLDELAQQALRSAQKAPLSEAARALVSKEEREKRKQKLLSKTPVGLFFGWLFSEDPLTAISKRMQEQFLPDLRNFLANTIIGGLEASLRPNGGSKTSYSTRSSSVTRLADNPSWVSRREEVDPPLMDEDIVYYSPRDVLKLVDELRQKYIIPNGLMSVNQLNEHLRRPNKNTQADNFGWYSLDGVRPRETPDGLWAAEFPTPVEIRRR